MKRRGRCPSASATRNRGLPRQLQQEIPSSGLAPTLSTAILHDCLGNSRSPLYGQSVATKNDQLVYAESLCGFLKIRGFCVSSCRQAPAIQVLQQDSDWDEVVSESLYIDVVPRAHPRYSERLVDLPAFAEMHHRDLRGVASRECVPPEMGAILVVSARGHRFSNT
jgi:hypothetical protein